MTTLHEAARMALEALEDACGGRCNAENNPCWQREAADALRAALAQPVEPEPVAVLTKAQARAILDMALDLEKTGRLVSLSEGQERSDFLARNRNIHCALRDYLDNLTEAAPHPPAAPAVDVEGLELPPLGSPQTLGANEFRIIYGYSRDDMQTYARAALRMHLERKE